MRKLVIIPGDVPLSHKPDAGDILVAWSGRGLEGAISLERQLESKLLKIRSEHMAWAYETGEARICPHASLAQVLEGGTAPSMWWTSLIYERHPKVSPELFPIYKLRCLELVAIENNCDCIWFYGNDKLASSALANLCKKRKWQFRNFEEGKPKSESRGFLRGIYDLCPAPLRAMARLAHWLGAFYARMGHKPVSRKYSGQKQPATIVTYFPNIDLKAAAQGRFISRYWESLHEALNRQAECEDGNHFVNWVFIRFPAPGLSFRQCLSLRNLFQQKGKDGLNFNYLEEFLGWRDIWIALARWFSISVKSRFCEKQFSAACAFRESALNFWPYISYAWAESFRGWRCLERCLQNQAFIRYFNHAGPQRWTLFPLENCAWERMLTEAARKESIGRVFGAQHSIVRPTDFRYFDDPRTFATPECNAFQPDIVGGNGNSACQQWLDNMMPESRLTQLEALRYLYLANVSDAGKAGEAPSSSLPSQPGEPLEISGSRRLLVVTSFFPDETGAHLDLLGKALDAGYLAGWNIVIKPHPYLSVDEWLASRPDRASIRLATGPMPEELTAGTVVWASNSTTAALEAALRNLAVMVMLPDNDFDLCPIQNVPGLCRTGTLEDVKLNLATVRPLRLPQGYLNLNPGLRAWRRLLKLDYPSIGV